MAVCLSVCLSVLFIVILSKLVTHTHTPVAQGMLLIIRLAHLQYSVSVAASVSSVVCLSRVKFRKLGEIGAKFRHRYRKSGSESKNMTSDFAPEVDKYPKKTQNPQIAQNRDLDN